MDLDAVVARLRSATAPSLLIGVSSGVATELAGALGAPVVTADIGLPLFGVPGAVCAGRRVGSEWSLDAIEALCTLDAARFRLPLLAALTRLVGRVTLVQLPDMTRGMAAAELFMAVVRVLGARHVLLGSPEPETTLRYEMLASGLSCIRVEAARPVDRARERSQLWDAYLAEAVKKEFDLEPLALLGAPPPLDIPKRWVGRQVALLDAEGNTIALGEALRLEENTLVVRAPPVAVGRVRSLLTRDARRDEKDMLSTERVSVRTPRRNPVATDLRVENRVRKEGPLLSLSSAKAVLVNGVFGDPLLHVRMRHQKRSLLFDLGDSAELPSRIVHQVTDVFISHAHFDHIGGFLGFLRSCLGAPKRRRIFGPPGITEHLESMVRGIRWDRIGDRGPVFDVTEVDGAKLTTHRFQAGSDERLWVEERFEKNGVLVDEPAFRVRSARLDHGIPVLAFAFEEARVFQVRKDALLASGYTAGNWLSELKGCLHRGELERGIRLPDGAERSAGKLARELVLERTGQKLCYATDLDDTPSNRRALVELAEGSAVFVCEASFVEEDRDLARATQHLTARACGEIASLANVRRLVPFHFSKRYEHDPSRIYEEIASRFPQVQSPTRLAAEPENV